ncbi:MAG: hypothetical protein H6741_23610 [Alphaproteobacteria bacterium]|nr:hypothetical protein [Alphaproteobacteria bacterium]MCB9795695.1 hypothetical protein [Alphaproteobacteria bacterium]
MGSLTVVGLGPARPEHVTQEAAALLRSAEAAGMRAYALAHARDMAAAVAPELEVRSLDWLYGLPDVPRPVAYQALARLLMRRAFEQDVDVLYLVAGSPLYINDAVLYLRRACAEAEQPLRLVHGISFVDLVLDRVFWTGHVGLQLYSAWNIARDGLRLSPHSPALLCQLGEFSAGGEALDDSRSTGMLHELRDRLLIDYPADHPVIILYSSGRPDYRSLARRLPLSELADATVPVYSNLWVPSLDGPPPERDMAPPSDLRSDEGDAPC